MKGEDVTLPARDIRRRKLTVRDWLQIDCTGKTTELTVDDNFIMERTGLQSGDLRKVRWNFSQHPPAIYSCDRAIVINILSHVRLIITAREVFLPNWREPMVAALGNKLQQIFRETEKDIGNASLVSLPFEYIAIVECLEAAYTSLNDEATTLEEETYPALDKLILKKSTQNLLNMEGLKCRLLAMIERVQKVRDAFHHLYEGDMVYSAKHDEEDFWDIVETYLELIEGTLNKVSNLKERVESAQNHVNLMLDSEYNSLLDKDALVSKSLMVLTFFSLIFSLVNLVLLFF